MGAAGGGGMTRLLMPLSLLALLLQIAAAPASASACAAIGNLVPYCGLPNPEDLEVLPGGSGVIASDMRIAMGPAGIVGQPGSLKWLDLNTRAVNVLYPSTSAPPGRPDWGDAACPGEIGAALMPHGIHLSRRSEGAWQLLVVNHGGRESVEFFELTGKKGTGKDRHWTLSWRGCVVPPALNHLNDVAALPGGGFLVSTMHTLGNTETRNAMRRAEQGENTGFLWRWTPGEGLSHQAGSDSPMPNGVQVDVIGHYAYLDTANQGGDVRKLDLARGEVVGTVAVPNPDNASWTADGRLLVAGVAAGASSMTCFAKPDAPCPVASEIYSIDPGTMRAERLFSHSGPPLGGATVAVQLGSDLLIGSCFGDRIMAVRGFFKPGSRKVQQEIAP
jgi:hypothetical protein